jgi:hypothetical protein
VIVGAMRFSFTLRTMRCSARLGYQGNRFLSFFYLCIALDGLVYIPLSLPSSFVFLYLYDCDRAQSLLQLLWYDIQV